MNRVLLKYFLDHDFETITLTSSRMKAGPRFWHFIVKRKILKELAKTLTEH
jgi:hypothetical protein